MAATHPIDEAAAPAGGGRGAGLAAEGPILVVLVVAAALYALYPSRTPEYDAMLTASAAIHGAGWVATDPGHLGFGPLVMFAARVARGFDPPLSPLPLLQAVSALAALVGLFAFDRALRALGVPGARAATFAGILAATCGFWRWSGQAESHALSTTFLLVALWSFVGRRATPSAGAAAASGAWLALATLMHQKNVLLVPAFVLGFALAARAQRRAVPVAGACLGGFAALGVLPYLAVALGVIGLRTIPEVRGWILGIGGGDSWGNWLPTTVPASLVGMTRALVGSDFALGVEPVAALAARFAPWAPMADERAVAATLGRFGCATLFALEAVVLAVATIAVMRAFRRLPSWIPGQRPAAALLLAWLAIHLTFSAWWFPEHVEFWIDLYPPLLALVALAPGPARAGRRSLLPAGVFLLALALLNLVGSIRPRSLASLDPGTRLVVALDATLPAGAVVLADTAVFGRESRELHGFDKLDLWRGTRGASVRFPDDVAARVDSLLAADRSGRGVYVLTDPLARDASKRASHRELLRSLEERHTLDERVPMRSEVELRRVRRGAGSASPAPDAAPR